MKIGIYPCPGLCNVSMMTKTVAYSLEMADEELIKILPNLSPLQDQDGSSEGESIKYMALNGCPSKCASKAFETTNIKPDDEAVITKDYDPKNNEKYAELLNIDEEVNMVQEVIDRILGSNK